MISRAHHTHHGAYLAVVDEDSYSVLYEDASFVERADDTDVALEWFDIDVGRVSGYNRMLTLWAGQTDYYTNEGSVQLTSSIQFSESLFSYLYFLSKYSGTSEANGAYYEGTYSSGDRIFLRLVVLGWGT